MIKSWSPPLPGEIRFDQGIGIRNPDTGAFVRYRLAGAYDSNIALLLTDGASRRESYERMAEVLRCTELRGDDLQTNLAVHYGLVEWFLGRGVMAEPSTRFMQSYLAAVGALQQVVNDVDVRARLRPSSRAARPRRRAACSPRRRRCSSGRSSACSRARTCSAASSAATTASSGARRRPRASSSPNPVRMLERLYHFLDLEDRPEKPPSEKIWDHDQEILETALSFYAEVERRTGVSDHAGLTALFAGKPNAALAGRRRALGALPGRAPRPPARPRAAAADPAASASAPASSSCR